MADKSDEQLRLMYPAGSQPHPDWEYKAWPSQTSMRNVDKQCEASIIQQYPDWNNTDEE